MRLFTCMCSPLSCFSRDLNLKAGVHALVDDSGGSVIPSEESLLKLKVGALDTPCGPHPAHSLDITLCIGP
jgi:hypothetical protein